MNASASSSSLASAQLSRFEHLLPHEAEQLEIALTPGVGAATRPPSNHAQPIFPAHPRLYNVLVEPGVRSTDTRKASPWLRNRVATAVAGVKLELPECRFGDEDMDALIDMRCERRAFREERRAAFQKHRYIPGLVGDARMMPSWSGANGAEQGKLLRQAGHGPGKRRKRLAMPTMSTAMKQREKADAEPETHWMATGHAEARKQLFGGTRRHDPAPFNGLALCDAMRKQELDEVREARKQRMRVHEVEPKLPGKNVTRQPTEGQSFDVQLEVEERRARGLEKLRSIKEQFASQTAKSKGGSATSNFDKFDSKRSKEKAAAQQEKDQVPMETPRTLHARSSLKSTLKATFGQMMQTYS